MTSSPFTAVATILLRKRGSLYETLCFQRSHRPGVSYPGQWCFPGGKPERGESLLQAAERELYEETGYTCPRGKIEPIGDVCLAPPLVVRPIRLAYFLGTHGRLDPDHRPEAGTQAAWFLWRSLCEGSIPSMELTPGTKEMLRIMGDL